VKASAEWRRPVLAVRASAECAAGARRWNEKFDFIDIPAKAKLTATIFDRSGAVESRLSLHPWKAVRIMVCGVFTSQNSGLHSLINM